MFQREDDAARWRQNNGVTRVDRVSRGTQFLSHPRIGGSWGYNIPLHQIMVDLYQAGNPAPEGSKCQETGRQAEEAWVGGEDSEGKVWCTPMWVKMLPHITPPYGYFVPFFTYDELVMS